MGRVHISLLFLSCALCQRSLLRPATVQPLSAKSLHCVWVSALYLDQFDCPQFPGNGQAAKLNDSAKQRMVHCEILAVMWWCMMALAPEARSNPHQRFTVKRCFHTAHCATKKEVFCAFCQINLDISQKNITHCKAMSSQFVSRVKSDFPLHFVLLSEHLLRYQIMIPNNTLSGSRSPLPSSQPQRKHYIWILAVFAINTSVITHFYCVMSV